MAKVTWRYQAEVSSRAVTIDLIIHYTKEVQIPVPGDLTALTVWPVSTIEAWVSITQSPQASSSGPAWTSSTEMRAWTVSTGIYTWATDIRCLRRLISRNVVLLKMIWLWIWMWGGILVLIHFSTGWYNINNVVITINRFCEYKRKRINGMMIRRTPWW